MSGGQSCLVVGAGGFLGKYVCQAMPDETLTIPASSDTALAAQKGWTYLDVTKPDTLSNLPSQVSSVIYLAQSPYYKNFPAMASHIWEVNVQGVLRLLEYARQAGARHFVLASSGSVYAPLGDDITENAPLALEPGGSFYAQSKIAAEALLHAYADYFSTTRLRLFTPYGNGLHTSMLMARMVQMVASGEPILLRGKAGLVFNPIHARDASRCIVDALDMHGHYTVNIAGNEITNLQQVATLIGKHLNKKPLFVKEDGNQRMVANISRMRELFGEPTTDLQTGTADLVNMLFS